MLPGRPFPGTIVALAFVLTACSGHGNGGFGPLPSSSPGAAVTTTPGPSATPTTARLIRVSTPGFRYEPMVLHLAPGESVVLELDNTDSRTHSLTVDELSLQMVAEPNERVRLPIQAPATGSFVMYCSISGHLQAGHTGRIDVG